MIYVKKIAICDGCGMALHSDLIPDHQPVNVNMNEKITESGWHFSGAEKIYCRTCWEKRKMTRFKNQ